MTKDNEKRADAIVGTLLTQFETMSEEMSFTSQLELA
jgi:hypothetical protein